MSIVRRPLTALLLVLVAAGGIATDRARPASSPKPRRTQPIQPGGAWACPFLSFGSGRSWVHLANAGDAASKVTVGLIRTGAPPQYQTFTLGGGHARTIAVPPSERHHTSAFVEYAGGEVYASRTAVFDAGSGRRGGAAGPCLRPGERTLVVPSGTTLKADTTIVLFNPSTSDAVASVSIVSGGEENQPEALKSVVVSARSRREVRLGDYTFDTKSASAVIRVKTGVVAADGVIASARGISLAPGVPPSDTLIALGTADAGGVLFDDVALGDEDTLADATLITTDSQASLTAVGSGIQADTPTTTSLAVSKTNAVAVYVNRREGSPLATAARWVVQLPGGRGDVSASMGVLPAARAVAVTGDPASGARSRILLANPGSEPATIHVTLLTQNGRVSPDVLSAIPLPAGRAISYPLGAVDGPVGVVAESNVPIGLAVSSAVDLGKLTSIARFASFAVTGLPITAPHEVAVEEDPRLGVPAP